MKPTPVARVSAVTAGLGTVLAGALVALAPTPAEAALRVSDYAFSTQAFGTRAASQLVGLRSGPTAPTYLGCTRLTGKRENLTLAAVDAPANNPGLRVGAVSSHSETFRSGKNVGSLSTNVIARVGIGAANGPHLDLKGLRTSAKVWADKNGKFHTDYSFSLADITSATGTPVDGVLNQAGAGIGTLFNTIGAQPGNSIVIPGVARVSIGAKARAIGAVSASSRATALRVVLFGLDTAEGGTDDTTVVVGSSSARIMRNMQAGVMSGRAWGANAEILGGLAGVHQVGKQPLGCRGTGGRVVTNSLAALNPLNLNLVDLHAVSGSAFGERHRDGRATAWTRGRLAYLSVGAGANQLVIRGVVGKANVSRTRSGKIVRSARGTEVASITVGGHAQRIPKPGNVLNIPGVATIRFAIVDKSQSRAIAVTALRVNLLGALEATTGLATIDLGYARARLARY